MLFTRNGNAGKLERMKSDFKISR